MPRVGGRDRTKERAIDFLRSTNRKLDSGEGARRGEENKTDRTRVFRRYEPILSECHALVGTYVDCQSYDIGSYEIVTPFLTAKRDSPRVYFSCHALRLNGS